jgi:DNA-binding IclR family transcriptional regulator
MAEPNKAKTARRVVEVLEYFDEEHRHATVMDIVRRYARPQSSTSELLASLVEMGLLYKDPIARSYTLTPRAAILGSLSQPSLIRDGRLATLIDQLGAQTGLGTALVGMVGLNAQLFRWKAGAQRTAARALTGGLLSPLCDSAAGWLLLSTIAPQRREGLLRRLNAEAPADRKFSPSTMAARIEACGCTGYAVGPAGFETDATMCAILLPWDANEPPLVLALVYGSSDRLDPNALVDLLQRSALRCIGQPHPESDIIQLVPDAA